MSADKIKTLVFPAGAENALDIYNSLKYNLHIDVYGASGKPDHARYAYPEDHYVEGDLYINNEGFINNFNSILKKYSIQVVIPTHDTITLFFSKHRSEILATVVTSPFETAKIAREKRLTYEKFRNEDFCPHVFSAFDNNISFPVFLKPNIGEGSKGTCLVKIKDDLMTATSQNKEMIVCEYLPGAELTVDCFTDRHRNLLFVGPRTRERIQMGISFHSQSIPLTGEISRIAQIINSSLVLRGAWFFQVKQNAQGKYKLLEISTRQAGTMALYRQLGVNFALLSVFDAMDIDVSIIYNQLPISLDRCLYNRYKINYDYSKVYVDFDDTIIVNEQININIMRYLYQCKNKGIRVILLTKHESNIYESLIRYSIAKELFDEIIFVPLNREKHEFIDPQAAIFIDNYFHDRKRVSDVFNIPVFDVDAVECLCD
jgi:hypothetical protein